MRSSLFLRIDVVRPAPAQAEYTATNPALGASLHTEDAGRALLAALAVPSGIYNVCRDGERVSHRRFTAVTGWRPLR